MQQQSRRYSNSGLSPWAIIVWQTSTDQACHDASLLHFTCTPHICLCATQHFSFLQSVPPQQCLPWHLLLNLWPVAFLLRCVAQAKSLPCTKNSIPTSFAAPCVFAAFGSCQQDIVHAHVILGLSKGTTFAPSALLLRAPSAQGKHC